VRAKAKSEGLRLVGIIEEAGESAHNLRRPGLARLFAILEDCAIGAVIVPDVARLARNPDDLARLLERVARRGIILLTIDECRLDTG
jgi:DNA invertase Pin-like site-specific DNA recombinase